MASTNSPVQAYAHGSSSRSQRGPTPMCRVFVLKQLFASSTLIFWEKVSLVYPRLASNLQLSVFLRMSYSSCLYLNIWLNEVLGCRACKASKPTKPPFPTSSWNVNVPLVKAVSHMATPNFWMERNLMVGSTLVLDAFAVAIFLLFNFSGTEGGIQDPVIVRLVFYHWAKSLCA